MLVLPLDRNSVVVMPDIAIEVLSPEDRPGQVSRRVDFFLRNDVRLVWVVDLIDETGAISRPLPRLCGLGAAIRLLPAPSADGWYGKTRFSMVF